MPLGDKFNQPNRFNKPKKSYTRKRRALGQPGALSQIKQGKKGKQK